MNVKRSESTASVKLFDRHSRPAALAVTVTSSSVCAENKLSKSFYTPECETNGCRDTEPKLSSLAHTHTQSSVLRMPHDNNQDTDQSTPPGSLFPWHPTSRVRTIPRRRRPMTNDTTETVAFPCTRRTVSPPDRDPNSHLSSSRTPPAPSTSCKNCHHSPILKFKPFLILGWVAVRTVSYRTC